MRLDIKYKRREKKNVKNKNTRRLKNKFLNNQQFMEEIEKEIKTFLETNDSENMTIQNLWDAAKALLREKFIAVQSYLKKTRKTSNSEPNFTPKTTGKRTKSPKISRRKES